MRSAQAAIHGPRPSDHRSNEPPSSTSAKAAAIANLLVAFPSLGRAAGRIASIAARATEFGARHGLYRVRPEVEELLRLLQRTWVPPAQEQPATDPPLTYAYWQEALQPLLVRAEIEIRFHGERSWQPTPEGRIVLGGPRDESLARFDTPGRIALFFTQPYRDKFISFAAAVMQNVEGAFARGALSAELRHAWLTNMAALEADIAENANEVDLGSALHRRAVERARALLAQGA